MVELEVRGVEIDRCMLCDGVFFDCGELSAVASRPLLPVLGAEQGPTCPDCGHVLRVATLPGRLEPGHALMGCECCEGLWLPGATVQALLGELRAAAAKSPAVDRCASCGTPFGQAKPFPSRQGLLCQACSREVEELHSGPVLGWQAQRTLEHTAIDVALDLLSIFL